MSTQFVPAGLRADARHNRERILDAARETFMTKGIDVPLSAIARRAGVGVATLYRRFPTRAALVAEAFTEQITQCAEVLEDGLRDPDPWHGLCSVLEKVCAMQVTDRGFTSALLSHFPDAVDYERARGRAEVTIAELVRRAKDSGQLRADFDASDIILLLMANNGVIGDSLSVSRAASSRLVGFFLHSIRAECADRLPPPAPLELRHIQD